MKKIFVSILIVIGIIMMVFPVLAASGTTDISKTENGDEVIYALNLSPQSSINAGDFSISYDPNVLTFVKIEKGPLGTGDNTIMAANVVEESHTVYVSYASLNDVGNGGTIANLYFKKNVEVIDKPVIGVDIDGVYDKEGKEISSALTGDSTVVKVQPGKTINDADNGAEAVQLSTEKTDESMTGKAEGDNLDLLNQEYPESGSTGFQAYMVPIAIGVVIVLVVLGAIVFFLNKKKNQ